MDGEAKRYEGAGSVKVEKQRKERTGGRNQERERKREKKKREKKGRRDKRGKR